MKTFEKKTVKRAAILFLLLAVLIGVFHLVPRPQSVAENNFIVGKGNRPAIIAHGGGNGEFPDNTMEAYYNAFHIDPRVIFETDVNMTKDGVIILCHDDTLDLTSNVSGSVSDWTYSDLLEQEVNFNFYNPVLDGFKISDELVPYKTFDNRTVTPLDVTYPPGVTPKHETKFLVTTLEELITAFPNNAILVDIKQFDETGMRALELVLDMMERLDAQYNTYSRMVLASFNPEIFEKIIEYNAADPRILYSPDYIGVLKLYATHWFGLDFLIHEPAAVMSIPVNHGPLLLNFRHFINAAHRHNIAVNYWTINDEKTMRNLAKKSADGIITDRPTLLKEILDELFGPEH